MIQSGIKISATQTFKEMLKKGWKIISLKKEKQNTFLVTLKKTYKNGEKIFEDIKTIFVGYWALPRTESVKDKTRNGSSRRGIPKPARMCYA